MGRIACTITLSGQLDPRFDQVFDGLELTSSDGRSMLHGVLLDQSQLQGVLRQLFDLGVDVVAFTAGPALLGHGSASVGPADGNHPGERPGG